MIENGIDRVADYRLLLEHRRIGLITNPSGVDRNLTSTAEILYARFNVTALYGPEHGINGGLQAGDKAEDAMNKRFHIPEYSLFGDTPRLSSVHLAEVDMVAFDIQDIGSRFFTYIYTMSDAMEECAKAEIPFVVLDRPNPIGGVLVEGTLLRPGFESFVGRFPLPVRHGFTAGEFAGYVNDRFHIGCQLTVIPCRNWRREQMFRDYDCSWLNPSPNMPSMEAALVYNGTCFLEGTNLSEGRGTTRPYEIIGAPFLENEKICDRMNALHLAGVIFRPCYFCPTFHKFKGEICRGIQLHVTDASKFNGFETGMYLFKLIREFTPELEITLPRHLDQLFGDDKLRLGTESAESIIERGRDESGDFVRDMARQYYLY